MVVGGGGRGRRRGGTGPRGQPLQAPVRPTGDPLLLVRPELQKSTQPRAGMPLSSPNCPPCQGPPTLLSSLRPERGCAERQESDEGGQGLIGQPHLPQAGLGGYRNPAGASPPPPQAPPSSHTPPCPSSHSARAALLPSPGGGGPTRASCPPQPRVPSLDGLQLAERRQTFREDSQDPLLDLPACGRRRGKAPQPGAGRAAGAGVRGSPRTKTSFTDLSSGSSSTWTVGRKNTYLLSRLLRLQEPDGR